MAKKARFYLAKLRNLDEQYQYMMPAQSEVHARRELEHPDSRIISIVHYGWHDVIAADGGNGPVFITKINNVDYCYEHNHDGYKYLSQQFYSDFTSIIDNNYSDD
ncbi:hypothetical protein [Oceanisphaera sp. IT1-181]|uniref:hypothetical protein n=1 Tax=Oceanisphaera sp. IT1-181 TaxID=3081199 RepID=UPI0029CA732F|nr:hypothetical protein [Oceanisphaera sp. IT1-181]